MTDTFTDEVIEIDYEEMEYDPPEVILGRLKDLEEEIRHNLDELENLLG